MRGRLDHLIYGLELGNEVQDIFTAAQQATNFAILHNLTMELWPDASRRECSNGLSPRSSDAGRVAANECRAPALRPGHSVYALRTFGAELRRVDRRVARQLPAAGGPRARRDAPHVRWPTPNISLDPVAYPIHGHIWSRYTEVNPTAAGFTDARKLAMSGAVAAAMNRTVREHSATARVFGGEIGPHNGGSPPCDHSSMRWATFGDSLWYADNLAAMARHGYDGLCREDFIGADCKSALCWVVCWLLLDFS